MIRTLLTINGPIMAGGLLPIHHLEIVHQCLQRLLITRAQQILKGALSIMNRELVIKMPVKVEMAKERHLARMSSGHTARNAKHSRSCLRVSVHTGSLFPK
jgi:hypothetical protein